MPYNTVFTSGGDLLKTKLTSHPSLYHDCNAAAYLGFHEKTQVEVGSEHLGHGWYEGVLGVHGEEERRVNARLDSRSN